MEHTTEATTDTTPKAVPARSATGDKVHAKWEGSTVSFCGVRANRWADPTATITCGSCPQAD